MEQERHSSGLDYSRLAFFLKKQFSPTVSEGPIRVHNRQAHKDLVSRAISTKMLVWYADVIKTETGKYIASHHHIIDFDSMPGSGDSSNSLEPVYTCEKCGKECSSQSGLTLHQKQCEATSAESKAPIELACPKCGKKCSSKSGLTLHIKQCGDQHALDRDL